MRRLPNIGERVRYTSSSPYHTGPNARTVTGTVRRIYPGSRCVDPDDDNTPIVDVRVGEPGWADRWSASVEVDELPAWWAYGPDQPRFAPAIADLEPIK